MRCKGYTVGNGPCLIADRVNDGVVSVSSLSSHYKKIAPQNSQPFSLWSNHTQPSNPRPSDIAYMTFSLTLLEHIAIFNMFIALTVTTMQLSTLCFFN